MKVKGEWKSWLKTQHSENYVNGIRSHHFMANRETVADFIFWGSQITADGDYSIKLKDACSLEEKLWPTYTAY